MPINQTSYMRTFKEFKQECSEVFPSFDDTFHSKNWTMQDHCGWTDGLYQAQSNDQSQVIEYMQDRTWGYHFNGVEGQGFSLDEAIKDHKVKYTQHLREN